MSSNRIISLFLVFSICSYIHVAHGLKCYNCLYESREGNEYGDIECKPGGALPDSLLVTCNENTTIPAPLGIYGLPVHSKTTTLGALRNILGLPHRQSTFGCAKVQVDGTVLGIPTSATVRSCTINIRVEAGCTQKTRSEWSASSDPFSNYVVYQSSGFSQDSAVEGCHCDTDQCNDYEDDSTTAPSTLTPSTPATYTPTTSTITPSTTPESPHLKCYSCFYSEGSGYQAGDPLCKPGVHLPDNRLLACNEDAEIRNPFNNETITLREFSKALGMPPNQEVTYGCTRIRMSGRVNGDSVDSMMRSCFPLTNAEPVCKLQIKSEWDEGDDEFSGLVSFVSAAFANTSAIEGCLCMESGCNNWSKL